MLRYFAIFFFFAVLQNFSNFFAVLRCSEPPNVPLLTQKDTATLVHAFVTSKLDNCNLLLAELPQYLLDKVQRVQNAAVRLVSRTRKYDRITPVLRELHWLPVKQRIIFKILLFTYKALNVLAPQYISDFLVQYIPPRALRSSDKKLL